MRHAYVKYGSNAACGGSDCHCDILPVTDAGQTKSYQDRINTALTGKAEF